MFPCACRSLRRSFIALDNTVYKILTSGYKSKISLENLYPKQEPNVTDKDESASQDTDKEKFSGVIPLNELQIQTCRSRGPGGQNVNKVNSKVEVRFKIDNATWIPDWIKPRLKEQQQNRVNKVGDFVVTSEKTRKQILNQADCLDKIRHYVFEAFKLPKELTQVEKDLIEKRKEAADKRRLEDKKRRSLMKQRRQGALLG